MATLRWSLRAADDLREIEEFIARDSSVYAIRLTDRIVEAVGRLITVPLSGRMLPEFQREDLREILLGSYRIVYLAREDEVIVLRVVHGARDLLRLAEREPWDTLE